MGTAHENVNKNCSCFMTNLRISSLYLLTRLKFYIKNSCHLLYIRSFCMSPFVVVVSHMRRNIEGEI